MNCSRVTFNYVFKAMNNPWWCLSETSVFEAPKWNSAKNPQADLVDIDNYFRPNSYDLQLAS